MRPNTITEAIKVLAVVVVLALLAGCNRKAIKPDLPTSGTIVKPEIVYIYRDRYVKIPDRLTEEQPIAEGSLIQCPDVGAQRKAALKKVHSQLREIRAIQGTAVAP